MRTARQGRRRVASAPLRRRGTSLVEVVVGMAVLAVAGLAFSSVLAGATGLQKRTREQALALDAAERVLEAIAATPYDEVFARYNATAADDPPTGASPGSGFAVEGLAARPLDPDGLPGEVVFPGDGVELREDAADPGLGTPRDLNDDGVVDGLDHAADHRVLPVRVRVRWRGERGDGEVELVRTL